MSPRRKDRRRDIALAAANRASLIGLEGLTLGTLAADIELSKSGLASLFTSKEALQLQAVEAAADVFRFHVTDGLSAPHGLGRLHQLVDRWIVYLDVFPGGCFFFAAAAEFDGRSGAVRDAVQKCSSAGLAAVREQIELAVRLGELARDIDPDQLTFELHGYLMEANFARQLLDDVRAYDRARRAITDRLRRSARGVPDHPSGDLTARSA